ncbi:tetratricopeptide repeat protein [Noviherbaspirillum sp. CPCC 100848]|uniref:Tetratricopeptide repeat protein n=1 Tax=Noviherbaspirillum album TaxID=3080276 RepID=A0ABU6J846_9BURK|nr:tetratricopeptide repeat protein [Noviherbaspirillum sp. CPCC 100848]MEC4719813.1 tetratricopeptide repeat protein [Noviherbaspirillum sp. CPCC 100848]
MRKQALFLITLIAFPIFKESVSAPAHLMPMFGGQSQRTSSKNQKALVAFYEKRGFTRKEGARELVVMGWNALEKKDYANAISQLNQAWLLDPENADVYYGFARIVEKRDKDMKSAEVLYRQAITKEDVAPETYVDYGRILLVQGRVDDSLEVSYKALDISPKVRDARINIAQAHYRKSDFFKACRWARSARQNGDNLPAGLQDQACRRADGG